MPSIKSASYVAIGEAREDGEVPTERAGVALPCGNRRAKHIGRMASGTPDTLWPSHRAAKSTSRYGPNAILAQYIPQPVLVVP